MTLDQIIHTGRLAQFIYNIRTSLAFRLRHATVILIIIAASMPCASSRGYTQWHIDLESGYVFSGYNDVRIPGDTGTQISLSEELDTDPTFFVRGRIGYSIRDRHTITVLIAPLRVTAAGMVNRTVAFDGEEFSPDVPLESRYRFDSYRLTYRFDFYRTDKLRGGLGGTAKIRDASISLEGEGKKAEKKNTGFVPLLNFRIQWFLRPNLSLTLDGDALAAPQGRAEDVSITVQYNVNRRFCLKTGYRVLEGGVDVDEVYNFTLLHYVLLGAIITF